VKNKDIYAEFLTNTAVIFAWRTEAPLGHNRLNNYLLSVTSTVSKHGSCHQLCCKYL